MGGGCDFGDTSRCLKKQWEFPMMPVRCPPLKTLTAVAIFFLLLSGAALRAADQEPASATPEAPKPAATAPAAAASVADSAPAGLPNFRYGLWEFRRTQMRADAAKPQVSIVKKCVDPGADMREKMANLKKKGCQFAPLRHSNDHYISSWICQTPTGAMRFRDVLLAKDPNSYQDVSETHTAQRVTQAKIEATRLADCPGMGSGAPLTPTRKPSPHHP
jgi:uncharacterized protein DUF3617